MDLVNICDKINSRIETLARVSLKCIEPVKFSGFNVILIQFQVDSLLGTADMILLGNISS
jgi:hypothetical protein